MSNKKQTAVEYFFNKMIEYLHNAESEGIYEVGTQNTKRWLEIFLDEAKELEKQHIVDAFNMGMEEFANDTTIEVYQGDQYYNETYNN